MKVLVAEDEPVSRRLLEALLRKWGYDVLAVPNGSKAWEIVQKPEAPGLVISDWMMPGMDGLELCSKIRRMEDSDYIYFIILTAKGNKEDVVKGLSAGADDYVIKPFDKEELRSRVRIGERIINLERQIRHMASIDPLTSVLNRRAFMERLDAEANRARRKKIAFSFVITDIDYFKKINDTFGHQAGDIVLQRFSKKLSDSLRSYDFVGRYGGEEFTICLPHTETPQARNVAERLRKSIEKMNMKLPGEADPVKITASFGVASYHPNSDDNLDSLVRRADRALYEAKSQGKNRVCVEET